MVRFDLHVPPFRPGLEEILHAVIADPPYGVRAGGRKSGGRKGLKGLPVNPVPEQLRGVNHYPSTQPYMLSECLADMVDLSARLLVPGGRLVYFYPCAVEEYHPLDLPAHPCLEFLHNCEDPISTRMSRRLITMRKVKPYFHGAKAEAAAVNAARAAERAAAGLGEVTVGADGLRKYVRPLLNPLLSSPDVAFYVLLSELDGTGAVAWIYGDPCSPQMFYGDKKAPPRKEGDRSAEAKQAKDAAAAAAG